MNKTLVEATIPMLNYANLSLYFYIEGVQIVCFVQYHSIINKRHNKTPYEGLNNKKPDVKFFHIFGCRCFIKNNNDHLRKFEPKAHATIFLGCSMNKVAYNVLKRQKWVCKETFDVSFDDFYVQNKTNFTFILESDIPDGHGPVYIIDINYDSLFRSHETTLDYERIVSHAQLVDALQETTIYFLSSSSTSCFTTSSNDIIELISTVVEDRQQRLHIWTKDHPPNQIIGNPYADFEKLVISKFQMSMNRDLSFFLVLQVKQVDKSAGEKKTPLWNRNLNAISFFVTGLADSSKKRDLFKCFEAFGEVVDVFMGTRRDKAGRNFAFVKFVNVGSARQLEGELQGMSCGGKELTVNLARYGRDRAPITGMASRSNAAPARGNPPHTSRVGTRWERRSFAEVISGGNNTPSIPQAVSKLLPPISLSTKGSSRNWVSKKVLIGEALSLDHMAALPGILVTGDGIIEKVKYVGGLNVAICFKDHSFAQDYLEDSGRWIEWLQWLKMGDDSYIGMDRIAWIKIYGLPLSLWEDDNLASIAKGFGKIIVPADEVKVGMDESIIRLGILTQRRNWINEVVAVAGNGIHFNIGVVEFDHNWAPFPVSVYGSDDSSDSSEMEEISDTDMGLGGVGDKEDEELEEGEFLRQSESNFGDQTPASTHVSNDVIQSPTPEAKPVDITSSWEPEFHFNAGKVNAPIEDHVQPTFSFVEGGSSVRSFPVEPDAASGDPLENGPGVFNFNFPISGFGPFPSNLPGLFS
ncbi:hypothetical protein LXL04_021444 [Taraxacum kok-saghyz]